MIPVLVVVDLRQVRIHHPPDHQVVVRLVVQAGLRAGSGGATPHYQNGRSRVRLGRPLDYPRGWGRSHRHAW